MRRIGLVLIAMFAAFALNGEDAPAEPWFIVHFEVGPAWDASLPPAEQPGFREHSANLKELRSAGTILFGARYGELGMIIVKAESLDDATALIESDPGVEAGIFNFRIDPLRVFYPWRAPESGNDD